MFLYIPYYSHVERRLYDQYCMQLGVYMANSVCRYRGVYIDSIKGL